MPSASSHTGSDRGPAGSVAVTCGALLVHQGVDQPEDPLVAADRGRVEPVRGRYAVDVEPAGRQHITKGLGSRAAGVAMALKLIPFAQARWRAVNAPHLMTLVRAGARFEKGNLVGRPDEHESEPGRRSRRTRRSTSPDRCP